MSGSVVFLMYHELELPGRSVSQADAGYVRYVLRQADFQAQMESLRASGWRGVSVGEAVQSFDERTVALTFDDGAETDLLCAAPFLKSLSFGGTFYITTGFMEKPGYLTRAQLRELSAMGFEIGCHSMTHPYLTDLNAKGLRREIAEPKTHLEQIVGRSVDHFSCPGGRHNRQVSEVAHESGYRTVTTSRIQMNSAASDRLALGRVSMMRSTSLTAFQQICRGQGLRRMSLQVQLRGIPKKLLGNSLYDRLRSAVLGDSLNK